MVKKVNHIGIIVKNIEQALIPYKECLGLKPTEIVEHEGPFNIRVVFLPVGDTQIELIQPLDEEGELVEFLRMGRGLHHIAFEVDEIEKVIQSMNTSGWEMKDKSPRPGANNSSIAFAEQEVFDGVLVEFVQPAEKEKNP